MASGRGLRMVSSTAAMVTVGILPGFLLAALAVLVRRDVAFTESELGFSVACGLAASALLSAPAGRITSRVGSALSFAAANGGVASGLLIIAFAQSWPQLTIGLTLAGCGNAFMQVAANQRIAWGIAHSRHGVAFGVKQAAIPGATMIAGLAVPALGVTLGWRPTFAVAATVAFGIMLSQLARGRSATGGPRDGAPSTVHPMPNRLVKPVRLFTVGVGCAAAALISFATFLPDFVVGLGWSASKAGSLLAGGSAICVLARIAFGWWADARPGEGFRWTVVLLAAGSVAMVILAVSGESVLTVVLAVLVVFAAGWGWSGLFNFAMVREAPEAPATVTGRTQAGVFAGGSVGPLLFGFLVSGASYQVAWVVAAASLAAAGALVARGRHVLVHAPAATAA